MKKTTLLLFVLCVTLLGIAQAADEFKAAVDKAGKSFMEGFTTKDPSKIGSLYAQDAIAFPPNSEMVKGREAIQTFWKGLIDAGMSAKIEIVETESDGNLGSEVGKYVILDPSGKTVDNGKYVVVWKKGKDGWKLYRDIWNSNVPVTPTK